MKVAMAKVSDPRRQTLEMETSPRSGAFCVEGTGGVKALKQN